MPNKYDDFLEKLEAGFFKNRDSATKSVSRRSLTQGQKTALMHAVEKRFGSEAPAPKPVMSSTFEEFLRAAKVPVRTLSEVPPRHLAYLSFLREAIQTNVDIAHGMKAMKEIDADIDTTEAQDVVNRLTILFDRYNKELAHILSIVDRRLLQ